MKGSGSLREIYRTAEDFRRYTTESSTRRRDLRRFFASYRQFFGRSVLDLACGGGVLGAVVAGSVQRYVGIDANPDMVRAARGASRGFGPASTFVLGDVRRAHVSGRFDTVTLLGNSLAHLDVAEMDELLRRRAGNVHPGSSFLVDYRDLIAMFWNGSWAPVKIQNLGAGKVVHRTTAVDVETGRLRMRARPNSRRWTLDWAHAIWSPFILENLMSSHGWRLVDRSPKDGARRKAPPEYYVEVYRLKA